MANTGLTRRGVLAATAATTLATACGAPSGDEQKRIAVVGGGIVGAAIAYFLAQGGAQVTVLERHGLATHASRGTFAWLNATWAKQPRQYHQLNQLGLAAWKELEQELELAIKWTGSLEWFDNAERQVRLTQQIAEQVEWGEPARMIELAELREMEPTVAFGKDLSAAYSPNDGALDPVLATNRLVQGAIALGARVKTDCEVTDHRLSEAGASVLETNCGELECDQVVLATGADPDATERLAGITVPQRTTPGVIVVTKPMAPVINSIIIAPGVHIHQRLDGCVVLGEQDGPPQTEAHAQRLAGRPNVFPSRELAEQHGRRILGIAAQFVPDLSAAELEDVFIGWRPLPLDGHPVVGFSPNQPNSYLAIAHSGVTLASIVGKMAAQELLNGQSVATLDAYRPDRDFEEVRRY